jgi:hypothetical protein
MIFRSISLLLASTLLAHASAPPEGRIQFNRDVRPILSDTCFHCHGFDEKERKGGLRLDVREEALKPAKSGDIAIVPGKPEESTLLMRVFATDPDDLMPPAKLHKPLKPEQKEILRRWIAEGAEYQGHWAFLKPERPTPPPGGRNAIDGFIQQKLSEQGLKPSPEAPKETLIRRATLDLTGLPPEPGEVAAFVNDPAPDAYERVVDRLLKSPRYGEHMSARWLDLARYADSNGFQSDTRREMWHWRDWVINAFNRNMPFDQFTIEQLGGDLLPAATRDQLVATGFNRNHRLNGEGGRIIEEWFAETVIDRVETTGLTWMGLTFNCCRCHDHKYDPISQKEFYQVFAYFNSNEELGVMDEFGGSARTRKGGNSKPVTQLPTPEQEKQLAGLEAGVKVAQARLDEANKTLPALQAAWEKTFARQLDATTAAWSPLKAVSAKSKGGATLTAQPDGSWLAGGPNPANDTYEIKAPAAPGQITGILLEVLPDNSQPGKSLGRSKGGNFVLSIVELEVQAPGAGKPVVAAFTRAQADYEQEGWAVAPLALAQPEPEQANSKAKPRAKAKAKTQARKNQTGWAVDGNDPAKRVPRKALFVCDPLTIPAGATLTVRLVHGSSYGDHNIGRFRLSTTSLPPAAVQIEGAKIPDGVRLALLAAPAKRTPAQAAELAKFFRENGGHPAKEAEAALTKAKTAVDDLRGSFANTMVFKERAQPREAFVMNRGEYDKIGEPVTRAVPAALPPLPAGVPNDRLGFAKWLVSGEHPLTARVWVNREWERFFGTGIVKTTENLGSQAEWPSHPALLDWLATEFVRVKWDIKAMHRLILTSATYRQSSRVTPELLEKDPENRLLARAPRQRLSAETLRDQALAISGLLVEKLGGPSVSPYMPAAVWDETSVYGDMRNYKEDTGEGLYRRTLYTIWKRTAAPPTMLLFDSPSREICSVKRSRSNTPLQALALLNEITYVEAARRLAERMMTEGGATPEARIAWAFARATARRPDHFELGRLTASLRERLTDFAKTPETASQLISQGASKPNPALNAAELAAYTVTANVLLNLDETVTRE